MNSRQLRYWLLARNSKGPFMFGARRIDIEHRLAHHDFLVVAQGQRGQGVAAQALANAVNLYRMLGVRHVYLVAGLTAGSSVWPKLGFHPISEADWRKLCKVITTNLESCNSELFKTFEHVHGRSLSDAVTAVVSSRDPKGIFDLLDIDRDNAAARAMHPELKFGLASELLRGGHWHAVLELDGEGGDRMELYLREKATNGFIDLTPNWARA